MVTIRASLIALLAFANAISVVCAELPNELSFSFLQARNLKLLDLVAGDEALSSPSEVPESSLRTLIRRADASSQKSPAVQRASSSNYKQNPPSTAQQSSNPKKGSPQQHDRSRRQPSSQVQQQQVNRKPMSRQSSFTFPIVAPTQNLQYESAQTVQGKSAPHSISRQSSFTFPILNASAPPTLYGPAPAKHDYPGRAEVFQRKYGLGKVLVSEESNISKKSIMEYQKSHDETKKRVAEAKARTTLSAKPYQPMIVDKAKAQAKKDRAVVNEKLSRFSSSNTQVAGAKPLDALREANNADAHSNRKYIDQHLIAANKARQSGRWNDVARHEQSASRATLRGELRSARVKAVAQKHLADADENSLGRKQLNPDTPQFSRTRSWTANLEHSVAGLQYKENRQTFSGSDSEEEIPDSPRTMARKDQAAYKQFVQSHNTKA